LPSTKEMFGYGLGFGGGGGAGVGLGVFCGGEAIALTVRPALRKADDFEHYPHEPYDKAALQPAHAVAVVYAALAVRLGDPREVDLGPGRPKLGRCADETAIVLPAPNGENPMEVTPRFACPSSRWMRRRERVEQVRVALAVDMVGVDHEGCIRLKPRA